MQSCADGAAASSNAGVETSDNVTEVTRLLGGEEIPLDTFAATADTLPTSQTADYCDYDDDAIIELDWHLPIQLQVQLKCNVSMSMILFICVIFKSERGHVCYEVTYV